MQYAVGGLRVFACCLLPTAYYTNARLARQHSPQLDIVVLRRQAHVVSAIGEQTDRAIEMAHVRQSVNDE